jgi:hypothetical protein
MALYIGADVDMIPIVLHSSIKEWYYIDKQGDVEFIEKLHRIMKIHNFFRFRELLVDDDDDENTEYIFFNDKTGQIITYLTNLVFEEHMDRITLLLPHCSTFVLCNYWPKEGWTDVLWNHPWRQWIVHDKIVYRYLFESVRIPRNIELLSTITTKDKHIPYWLEEYNTPTCIEENYHIVQRLPIYL